LRFHFQGSLLRHYGLLLTLILHHHHHIRLSMTLATMLHIKMSSIYVYKTYRFTIKLTNVGPRNSLSKTARAQNEARLKRLRACGQHLVTNSYTKLQIQVTALYDNNTRAKNVHEPATSTRPSVII